LTLSLLGAGMWIVAVVWQVIELGGGPAELSLVAAGNAVGMLVAVLFGGVLADRVPQRNILLAVEATKTVSIASAGVLALSCSIFRTRMCLPAGGSIVVQGPERVAIVGPNGIGKTTLLEDLVRRRMPPVGLVRPLLLTDRAAYLPQRLDGLDEQASMLESLRAAAPSVTPGILRNRLARFLLCGDSVHRPVGTVSGGKRFRVSLARLLFAEPPAQLLVLDEPTNNLDLESVD
jgi:ATPase subunit of ABC transporter with duplicated ATPase domains